MKHGRLHSVAHNFADSLASGLGFVVGYYPTEVFRVAAVNEDGSLLVDFLRGTVESEHADSALGAAISLYRNTFPEFCEKNGVKASDFQSFLVRYVAAPIGHEFVLTIEDLNGKRTSRKYTGTPGKRTEILDRLGRRRPNEFSTPLD